MKKTKGKTKGYKLGASKKGAKFFLKDAHDRNFTAAADGFDVELKAGVAKEVTKEAAEALKTKYEYLEVITE